MTYYYGIIYFRNGTTRTTGKSNDRRQAERMAISMFETAREVPRAISSSRQDTKL